MRRFLAPLSLAVILAACGSAADAPSGTVTPSPASADPAASAASTSPAPPQGPATVEVDVVEFAFDPGTVSVAPGTTIAWTNHDDFAHTVTSGAPGDETDTFHGELGSPGSHDASGTTFEATLEGPGTYDYFCRLHPDMRGTITVTTT